MLDHPLTLLQITNLALTYTAVVVAVIAVHAAFTRTGGSKARTAYLFLAIFAMVGVGVITATVGALNITIDWPEFLPIVRGTLAFLRVIFILMLLYYIADR